MAENLEEVIETPESLEEKPEEKEVEQNGVEEEDEEENEEEEEKKENQESGSGESDQDGELGSLEKPVEILTNKRDRKSVERYVDKSEEKPKSSTAEELDFTKGKGIKLGEIEFVEHSLDRTKSDELKQMHRLLFGRIAKASMTKRNIRAFCGYPFEKETIHHERLESRLDRMLTSDLRFICGILGLEKPSNKEQVKENLQEYLFSPKDLGKSPKIKQRKKSKTPSKKRKSKDSNKKKKQKEEKEVSSADDSESEDEEKEPKTPTSKKKSKKVDSAKKSSAKKKDTKKTMKVSIGGKKSSEKKNKKRKEMSSDEDSDDDDDEPLIKKTKKEPADDEIKSAVEVILKDADLEQVTMKTVCKQVYDKFPDFDLTPRKDFIKATVKEIIS